jgi:hypothetical protein
MISVIILLATSISATAEDITLIGRLTKFNGGTCGVFRSVSISEYEVLAVFVGTYSSATIKVLHPCIDMPREMYSKDAGTLKKFVVGDLHKLVLTTEDIHEYEETKHMKRPHPSKAGLYSCRRVDLYRKWMLWLHNQ